jgi:hypothetical protein
MPLSSANKSLELSIGRKDRGSGQEREDRRIELERKKERKK